MKRYNTVLGLYKIAIQFLKGHTQTWKRHKNAQRNQTELLCKLSGFSSLALALQICPSGVHCSSQSSPQLKWEASKCAGVEGCMSLCSVL